MTCYHIMITTKSLAVKEEIMEELNSSLAAGVELEIQEQEHEDDPGEESGDYILWYMSGSHLKVRYYAGPPKGVGQKPQWSYEKKEAAKLSQKACKLVAERIAMMGYKTPLKIDKGGPDLTVVEGNFKKGNGSDEDVMAKEIHKTLSDAVDGKLDSIELEDVGTIDADGFHPKEEESSDAELEAKFLAQGGTKLEVSPEALEKIKPQVITVKKAPKEDEE